MNLLDVIMNYDLYLTLVESGKVLRGTQLQTLKSLALAILFFYFNFLKSSPEDMFIDFRERGREKKREK